MSVFRDEGDSLGCNSSFSGMKLVWKSLSLVTLTCFYVTTSGATSSPFDPRGLSYGFSVPIKDRDSFGTLSPLTLLTPFRPKVIPGDSRISVTWDTGGPCVLDRLCPEVYRTSFPRKHVTIRSNLSSVSVCMGPEGQIEVLRVPGRLGARSL